MQEVVSTMGAKPTFLRSFADHIRIATPSLTEWLASLSTSLLLILSFPNFALPILAWIALVPLLLAICRQPIPGRAFILGWTSGTVFFYVSCYWLTYSMIHYGGLPVLVSYLLLVPGAVVMGLFPGLFATVVALFLKRWGRLTLMLAPFVWASTEWLRLGITGQLWNALGYSQAGVLNNALILPAAWAGVYGVSFLILCANAAIALIILERTIKASVISFATLALIATILFVANNGRPAEVGRADSLYVVAVQPNVPMNLVKTVDEIKELLDRHLTLSKEGLNKLPVDGVPRLVIWPESPMNFSYATDREFQKLVSNFTTSNHTSLVLNSLEPAPNNGGYNSALLINEQGRLISQYDKIRLLPFGEYVPLPQWLPGASLITGLVGDFTPGNRYTVMPVGKARAGVFICIESAYPSIARRLSNEGADLLINISNDGYLGPTAVMRQHLANAVFRAVESGREVLRVTNSGITADIRQDGLVQQPTEAFRPDIRTWKIDHTLKRDTFYVMYGDVFVECCAAITLIAVSLSLIGVRKRDRKLR